MSPENVHYLNVFLGTGAILLQIFSVSTLLLIVFRNKNKENFYLDFIHKHFLLIGFLFSLFASVLPLIYSDVIHFPPCDLCWWQRVFMFPLTFMFAVALWHKDRKIIRYAFPLLSAGLLVSLYHNFFYYFGENTNLPCGVTGVSCFQRLVSEFGGYISIPMMALSAFVALLSIVVVAYFYKREV